MPTYECSSPHSAHIFISTNETSSPSNLANAPHSQRLLRKRAEIQLPMISRHVLPTGNAMNLHVLMIRQSRQQLRRDQEVLARVLGAGDLHHAGVDETLVARVHALVNLVDDAEGRTGERLQGHEEEDGADGTLAAGLAVGV